MGALSWRLRRKWCSDWNKAPSRYPWINPCKKLRIPGRFSALGDGHLWRENWWRIWVPALISQICGILEREIDNGDIQRQRSWLMDLHFLLFFYPFFMFSFFKMLVKEAFLLFFFCTFNSFISYTFWIVICKLLYHYYRNICIFYREQ